MADVTKPARRGRERAKEQVDRAEEEVSDRASDVEGRVSDVEERAGDVEERAGDVEQVGRQGQQAAEGAAGQVTEARASVTSELKDTIREAAIEILKPVARQATKSAAKYAVTRGPDLVKERVIPRVEEAGGAGALAKGALSKGGALAKGGPEGGGLMQKLRRARSGEEAVEGGRAVPMQAHVDVASDLETVYDQFTQFEDFPEFAEHLDRVRQRDDTTLTWHESVRRGRRSWQVEIVEQRPGERIVLRGVDDPDTVGVVTFHRLSDKLTRVDVSVMVQPKGLMDKIAVRAYGRALESELTRFKAWVELRDEATGAWRGRIEEGAVVGVEEPEEEEYEEEEEGGEEPEAEEEEEPEAEEEEEPEAEEEEEPEAEEEEEPEAEVEEEEEPRRAPVRRRRPTTRRSPASGRSRR